MIKVVSNFLSSGGIFMIPLVLCSIVSVAFILERGFALRRKMVIQEDLKKSIEDLDLHGSWEQIQQIAQTRNTTLARLICKCLEHLRWSKAENVESLQTCARGEIVALERGLVVLEIIVGISPLLGLLGTLSGLIVIFNGVAATSLAQEGIIIARGIAEALNATVAGLVVAIPSLIAHSYYLKKVETFAAELENICMDLLAKLYLNAGQ